MKKLLGSALTLALVFPSGPASAELLKNLKVSGGVDLQAVSARNVADFQTNRTPAGVTGNDRLGTTTTRTWAGLGWDLLDDVHAKATVRKNDRAWGTAGANAAAQGAAGNQAWGAAGVEGNLFVTEANIKIDKLFGHLDSTWGRQFWGEPGDLIAFWGPKNVYGLFVTAIDAVSASASNDWMDFQGIAGRGNATDPGIGTTAAGAATNPVDVRGIDLGWKGLPVKVNTFLWNQVTHGNGALGAPPAGAAATAGGLNDNLWLYGAKFKAEGMGGWLTATVAMNSGSNRLMATTAASAAGTVSNSSNYIGKGMLLDMGYKMDVADIGGFTPWLTYGWGSGRHAVSSNHNENFTTIASDFRPGVIYGRFNTVGALALGGTAAGAATTYDVVGGVATPGLTNRIIWGGGLKFNCARTQKMSLGISYWDFNYQRATLTAGRDPVGPLAVGNRHIGSEFDLQADWAHSENVMLSGGWATFQPGGFIKETIRTASGGSGVGVNPVNLLFADLSVKF